MARAPVVILEGTWWNNHEVPLILPYFQALATSHRHIDLWHRTIKSADDIAYYVSRIPKNAGALLYFACHGDNLRLLPGDGRQPVSNTDLLAALNTAKEGAVDFVHFGCCEMVDPNDRRGSHETIMDATGAKWVSGYTDEVEWLRGTFLDLALVSEVFVEQHGESDGRKARLSQRADDFLGMYDELARKLSFSALIRRTGDNRLFPSRLHRQAA